MGFGAWITCGWPGLPRLWWRGQWLGLFTAVIFAIGLNGALCATFLIPHLLPPWGWWGSWAGLAVFWLVCVRRAVASLSQIYCGDGRYNDALFSRAQEEYLRGQWFEAESLLLRLVRDNPADIEGRLLLATLYRHTRRPELARLQLNQMERFPHAGRWRWEMLRERNQLQRLAAGEDAQHASDPTGVAPAVPANPAEDSEDSLGQAATPEEREPFPEGKEPATVTKETSASRGGLSKAA